MRSIWMLMLAGCVSSLALAIPQSGPGQQLNFSLSACQTQVVLPQADSDGRRKVKNKRGFEDSQFNETQLAFIARAKKRAQLREHSGGGFRRQPMVMEVGMAYGTLGMAIVTPDEKENLPGAFYFGIDMEPQHVRIADARLREAQVHSSQYQVFKAQIPIAPSDTEAREALASEFESFEITDIGMFSVAMYLNGQELQQFMKWAFDLLPSGGRLYMTAISPYSNLYPGYEATYLQRRDVLKEAFPGFIADVRSPQMAPFIPDLATYLSKYPSFFHLLEPEVLRRVGSDTGFVDIEAKYLRRLFPENLLYRGTDSSVGELSSFIGTKP